MAKKDEEEEKVREEWEKKNNLLHLSSVSILQEPIKDYKFFFF